RAGVRLTRPQAHLHALLDPILRAAPEGRRLYSRPTGERLVAGDTLRLPELADTLEAVARRGPAALYRGERARALAAAAREGGGDLTLEDLTRFRGHEVVSNPPPSSGGVLIAFGLALLDGLPTGRCGSAEAIAALAEVMRAQLDARSGSFSRDLHRGGLARRLLDPAHVRRVRARLAQQLHAPLPEAVSAGGTTHVSVTDGEGNAASASTSTGSGSGVVVPGTGVYMNNMLGEYDLVGGRSVPAGRRLTSMMAPTLALGRGGRPALVVGSAGSARLRGAIMQIVVNVLGHGLGVEEAIAAPRVHLDEPHLHCEGGHAERELERLERRGYDVVRWRRRNLFFGGAAAVQVRPDGSLAAA